MFLLNKMAMKIFRYRKICVFALILSFSAYGCSNTYTEAKTISRASAYPRVIERAKKDKRYFIMYSGVDTYAVTSVEINKSNKQFTVQLDKVGSLHTANTNNTTPVSDKLIHVYMRDSTSYTLDEPHTIDLDKVAKIELVH